MRQLHTVNGATALPLCLRVLSPGDALLLIEDGVYLGTGKGPAGLADDVTCFALAEDLAARGLDGRIAQRIQRVDMAGFVALCSDYDKVVNWF